MCAVFTFLGSATAFMLLAAFLVNGAGGDDVTSQLCRNRNRGNHEWQRVRQYPEDRDATLLWLDHCSLDQINEADIIGLSNITTIDLEYNTIAHVDLAVFRHVPTLEQLSLYNNKLRELPAFPEHSCPRLTTLSVSHNQLTTLHDAGTFSACTQLETLRLNYNQITSIHPDAFSSLTELKELYLYTNKLSYIPDQMFVNNNKLRYLYLHNNRLTYLPHDFASSLKRAGGGLVTFYFYGNPWRCACLLELLADVQRAGVLYWPKYGGTWPQCVYSGGAVLPTPPLRAAPPAPRRGGRGALAIVRALAYTKAKMKIRDITLVMVLPK